MSLKSLRTDSMLFPHYFRGIGWCLFFVAIVLFILKSMNVKLFVGFNQLISRTFLLVGLTLPAFSRLKTEDERAGVIRLKSMEWAFFASAVYTIVHPWINMVFKDQNIPFNATSLMLSMLIIYHVIFFSSIRAPS